MYSYDPVIGSKWQKHYAKQDLTKTLCLARYDKNVMLNKMWQKQCVFRNVWGRPLGKLFDWYGSDLCVLIKCTSCHSSINDGWRGQVVRSDQRPKCSCLPPVIFSKWKTSPFIQCSKVPPFNILRLPWGSWLDSFVVDSFLVDCFLLFIPPQPWLGSVVAP